MSTTRLLNPDDLDAGTIAFYRGVMHGLTLAGVPFLLGGGFALRSYTQISRDTKDIDLFVLPEDVERGLESLSRAGYRTDLKFPHWLGKVCENGTFVDIIFSSGNGLCSVDALWFEHANDAVVLDLPVKLAPPEEMIWQKAFIMERHRYDGADVAHLLQSCGETLDWDRLVWRFGDHWPVLLGHLVLSSYIYPNEQSAGAKQTLHTLLVRMQAGLHQPSASGGNEPLCRGTFLSLLEYLPAVERWGYRDARLRPTGTMTHQEIEHWTATFER